jgi:acyl-CoA dehydrogenase
MGKLFAADILNRIADYSLQVHGGYGYMAEYEIGRVWKDARVKRISAGTDEVQREIISRDLLGRPRSGRRH